MSPATGVKTVVGSSPERRAPYGEVLARECGQSGVCGSPAQPTVDVFAAT
jgi:hypothetical protein